MEASAACRRRRTHTRSRQGCSTCKQRHKRCDEKLPKCSYCLNNGLQCSLSGGPPAAKVSKQQKVDFQSTTSSSDESTQLTPPSRDLTPLVQLVDPLGVPKHWSNLECSLMHTLVRVVTQMKRENGHLFALTSSIMPAFIELAFFYDYLRFAALTMATMTLAQSQRSSEMYALAQGFRDGALRQLAVALNNFSEGNADAILATSVVLAYSSSNPMEHKSIEDGVCAVIRQMRPYSHNSRFPQYFRGPFDLSMYSYSSPPTEKPANLDPNTSRAILNALRQLTTIFTGQVHFESIINNLKIIVRNLSEIRLAFSMDQQYQMQESLRPLNTTGLEYLAEMGGASVPEQILMAFHECVMFIVEEFRPETCEAYFILGKADVVVTIYETVVQRLAREQDVVTAPLFLSMIEVPYKIAQTYRSYGRVALW